MSSFLFAIILQRVSMEFKEKEEDVSVICQGKIGEGQNAEIREMPK
jgi:hypothetical protein